MKQFLGIDKYEWTKHAQFKMRQYGLSEQRIKRVIRYPYRSEEGIASSTVAVMQPASVRRTSAGKPAWSQEIWAMYKVVLKRRGNSKLRGKTIRIITAWRYPGVSPKRDPIPEEVLMEIQSLL
ncbi:hypothetical protein CL629_01830 [bacterium]|nr:hypothetical protein [bacterium]|tara:strand:- start:697 stop:1065 length:369 start_codon:yes stop_codon:yes gene_type:complete